MKKDYYRFRYALLNEGIVVYEGACTIGLNTKEIEHIAQSIRDCQSYGGTEDIPSPIFEKIIEAAKKDGRSYFKTEEGRQCQVDELQLETYMPAKLLRDIEADKVSTIEWEEILQMYEVDSFDELWKIVEDEVVEPPVSTKKVYDGPYMKTLATMQPWASLIVCGIKDVELRDKLPAKPRKIFIAASGSKWKWEDLDDFAQSEYKKYEAKGVLPPYDKLPQKCIVGYVDIVNVTFEDGGSPWERGHEGIRYVLRNAHELDEPLYGKNKATPYFYNVEGYDEDHLPPAHICDLN